MPAYLPVTLEITLDDDNSTFLVKRGGRQRKVEYNSEQFGKDIINLFKLDELIVPLEDAKIILQRFLDWVSILKFKYGAIAGVDSTRNVVFSQINGEASISFSATRDLSVSYSKDTNEITFQEGDSPTQTSLATTYRTTIELLDWIKRDFRIWWNASLQITVQ
ncbi:hypothetical protein HYS94_01495 [Candidatus Daviesbacteria bacterium]|nr:hypothetical protein [Candidatus Daviesbacteria bacterium]